MKEPDMEGVASRHGPGSWAGGRNIADEASIGICTGQPLISGITALGAPTGLRHREGHARLRHEGEQRCASVESKALACAATVCPRTGRPQRFVGVDHRVEGGGGP